MKRVLIAINQFPATGGSRIEKFIQLLPEHGWEPIVLTSRVRNQTLPESKIAEDFSKELRVERVLNFLRSPLILLGVIFRARKLARWVEDLLYFPDRWVGWAFFARRRAKKLVEEEGIDIVLTSSPVQSTHLIGKWLHEEMGVPWIADFRDLWTTQEHRFHEVTRWHLLKARELEQEFYDSPDHVIANTLLHKEVFEREFSVPGRKITVITNGFDESEFQGEPPAVSDEEKAVFRAAYLGYLVQANYPWEIFLEGYRRFVESNGISDSRLDLFMPPSQVIERWAVDHAMEKYIIQRGYLPHREVIALARTYDLLTVLMVDTPSYRSTVPQKLYNCLPMEKPILAVIPEEGFAAEVLRTTGTGRNVGATDPDRVAAGFLEEYRAWKEGRRTIEPVWEEIEKYSRQRTTQALSELLNRFSGRGGKT